MPEDELLRPPSKSKKKRRRKKATASSTPPENAEKPQTSSLPPEISTVSVLRSQSPNRDRGLGSKFGATSKEGGERLVGSGRRRKKHPKDSSALLTATNKTSGHRAVSQGCMAELGAKESLRWEGALEDPQAEEKRLALYRANRRRRYIAHREALLKETQDSLRQRSQAFNEIGQQETSLLLHLIMD